MIDIQTASSRDVKYEVAIKPVWNKTKRRMYAFPFVIFSIY